jgi:CubicO group peptidase (beta-lactamase class C family)
MVIAYVLGAGKPQPCTAIRGKAALPGGYASTGSDEGFGMRTPARAFVILALTGAALAYAISPAGCVGPGDPWQTAKPIEAGLNPAPLAGLQTAVARGDYAKTTSVLIVRNGQLAYEQYFGEGRPDLLNDTRSAMKAVTALAVGAAIGDGVLASAQARAFSYFADLKPFRNDTADKEAISVADLLSMSSALDCDDNDDNSAGNEDKMHQQPNWTRWAVDLPTMAGYARDRSGLGPWRYCTVNAVLAGQVIQRATRRPVDQYIETRLFVPLGIASWDWPRSPAGEVMTGGGLRLRSRDLAKIAWLITNNGRWNGRQVVPAAWIDQMLTVRRGSRPDQNYGYFIFEGDYKTACGSVRAWYMAGNGGSQILILKDLNAAVVVTRTNFNVRGTSLQTVDLLEKYVLPSLPCAR